MKRWLIVCMTFLLLPGCSSISRIFTPDHPFPPRAFSHKAFDEVLQIHVREGVVDYPNIANDPNFALYLEQLKRVAPNRLPTPNHRLAFWINAYNAFAIKGILDGLSPVTTLGKYQYFWKHQYPIGGSFISLYDLEQEMLIKDFLEPRIHFAIVCASKSCPSLHAEAYDPVQLDQQLEESARRFINDSARNRFDPATRTAYLSKIFEWFIQDFKDHSGSLTNYIARYVNAPILARELTNGSYAVEFLEYDWNLNGIDPIPEIQGFDG